MSAVCDSPVKGKMLRATKLDPCGAPALGAGSWPTQVVTKGFVTVEYAPEFDDGDEIEQKNADGDACVYEPARRRVKFINVTVTACRVDPELYTLITGMPVVLDETGTATGMRLTSAINADTAVALEVWSGTATRRSTAAGLPRFGYFLLPQVIDGHIGDFTIENGAATFTRTGKAVENPLWGVGPYPVYLRPMGVAPLAAAMGERDLLHLDWTSLPPPAPVCGLVPRPPEGTVTRDPADATGMTVVFTATFVPAGPPTHSYTVAWGDGSSSPGPAAAGTVSHQYAGSGVHLVTITDTTSGAQRFAGAVTPLT
jgi:hypothetical protein